jgi:UDP-N-acetylglucosamine 2-epimerase (non-hydrolysing)/GDP/UDP-N,N'-diacetylbacillosamine 2-epimerase (hydrolysing)
MTGRICVVTGSRADYGLLQGLMRAIAGDPGLRLQTVATGMHLVPEFGLTWREIERDGFALDAKVETVLGGDTAVAVGKAVGLGVIGFTEILERLGPDLVVLLGDRYEVFAAAQAAMVLQIPVAHLGGGDTGAGTIDNVIRHCITKIASLHFVTHAEARRRVLQLGEDPERVFCVGSTGVDAILATPLLDRAALERELGVSFRETILLATFHPLTMDAGSAPDQLRALLEVLEEFRAGGACSVVFTKANADHGGRELNRILEQHGSGREGWHLFSSLGRVNYLSLVRQAAAVVGNSSSGIYEAPYLGTPTVDIGSRQQGRAAPASVLRCEPDARSIRAAIRAALAFRFEGVGMIYGDGRACERILAGIKQFVEVPGLARKAFFDLGGPA